MENCRPEALRTRLKDQDDENFKNILTGPSPMLLAIHIQYIFMFLYYKRNRRLFKIPAKDFEAWRQTLSSDAGPSLVHQVTPHT